jgi:hypothetical protein
MKHFITHLNHTAFTPVSYKFERKIYSKFVLTYVRFLAFSICNAPEPELSRFKILNRSCYKIMQFRKTYYILIINPCN